MTPPRLQIHRLEAHRQIKNSLRLRNWRLLWTSFPTGPVDVDTRILTTGSNRHEETLRLTIEDTILSKNLAIPSSILAIPGRQLFGTRHTQRGHITTLTTTAAPRTFNPTLRILRVQQWNKTPSRLFSLCPALQTRTSVPACDNDRMRYPRASTVLWEAVPVERAAASRLDSTFPSLS